MTKDTCSLLRIEESLDCLNGVTILTSLDLKAGYWQVEMEENNIPYTAFTVGPLRFYKCICMPFGLTNAPATFQCLIESCLGDYHLKYCIIYLNNIIIFSKNLEEHFSSLQLVFQKLDEAGLHLKPSKFFKDRLEYWVTLFLVEGSRLIPRKLQQLLIGLSQGISCKLEVFLAFVITIESLK